MPISPRTRSNRVRLACMLLGGAALVATALPAQARQIERLDRGVVAVPAVAGAGILVSWRLLATDPATTAFNIYRDGVKLNPTPLDATTNYVDPAGAATSRYTIKVVLNGVEQDKAFSANVWAQGYLTVPLQRPAGGTTKTGEAFTYTANDASVGDLNGDGKYDIVLKWEPTNAKDNSQSGVTGNVIFDAYTMEGRRLWRVDMGPNIRAGAHYTQFMVYDFDGNGKAEVIMKTADGTVDGQGRTIGDGAVDHRNTAGYVLKGPEFLTAFEGTTGRAVSTIAYVPQRFPGNDNPTPAQIRTIWGDDYGNRIDRFLAGVAYLDGERPSAVMTRGYYTRTVLWAVDFRNGQLTQRWLFDSANGPGPDYAGQGNHELSVADVDADGKDEIIFGSMAVDDNGAPLWSGKSPVNGRNLGHGDALHVGDLDPNRPGIERFGVHESPGSNGNVSATMMDARTGQVIWYASGTSDNGRGLAMDIDPRYPGAESWSGRQPGTQTVTGQVITTRKPGPTNFGIWWDGDKLREFLDQTRISKWNWETATVVPVLDLTGTHSNNGTKATPNLSADLFGDWREEVMMAASDDQSLRIYATPYVTGHKLVTLMHDPVYRLAIAWQNVSYNQPPHTSFYLGE